MNKLKKTTLSLGLMAMPLFSMAQANSPEFHFGIQEMLWLVTACMLLLLVFLYLLFKRLQKLLDVTLNLSPEEKAEKTTIWEKMLFLKPMSAEKDLLMDHEYDGIQELDNPTPPWFNFLFYGTILFAIVYLINFHVVGDGKIMENEYAEEMKAGELIKAKYMKSQSASIDETNVVQLTDEASIKEGADIFMVRCSSCHGKLGEGGTGPNLTDEYWLHGGDVKSIFNTIKYGVPAKGMIPWNGVVKPEDMQKLASFILSIKGTVPDGAGKAPQGEKMEENTVPAADTTSAELTALN